MNSPSRSKIARCIAIFRVTPRRPAPISTAWASARSARIGEAYAQNRREVPAYQAAIAERGIATMRGYRLSDDDRIRRAVIGRLLCHTVIPKHEIEREFSISFDEYFAPEVQRLEESARRRPCHSSLQAKFASLRSAAFSFATSP